MSSRRRAMLLVLTLLTLAFAAALVLPLATLSGTVALEAGRDAQTLQHRLAVWSLVMLLPDLLENDALLVRDLDRDNYAIRRFTIGAVELFVAIQDDQAKLPLRLFSNDRLQIRLHAALQTIQSSARLSGTLRVPAEIEITGCNEDVFAESSDTSIFGMPGMPGWTRYVSPLGAQLSLQRTDRFVLEAALQDVRPGLGARIAALRGAEDREMARILDRLDLPATERRAVEQRIRTTPSDRYSLLIRTQIGRDVRQHYIVCRASDPPVVLVDWEVAP